MRNIPIFLAFFIVCLITKISYVLFLRTGPVYGGTQGQKRGLRGVDRDSPELPGWNAGEPAYVQMHMRIIFIMSHCG